MTARPQTFFTAPCFTYEPGQQLFQPRDAERISLTVVRTTYGPDGRRPIVVLQRPGREKAVNADPHHLVHVDEALRPTRTQLAESFSQLAASVDAHTAECRSCQRQSAWWGTCYRCVIGRRMIDAAGGLSYYRDNVLPWLTGKPVDPARVRGGQHVNVRPNDGPEFEARIAQIADGGRWHEAGENGAICVRTAPDWASALYPVAQVFHRP
ncbi:hypothetical protein ACPXCO_24175 [Streptomyces cyaneofuscatus]|uniref:hypothetical protein n=1 Tax=Streptomyces cyaneofuscatus TaxID=66883 RepID=UPI003CEE1960